MNQTIAIRPATAADQPTILRFLIELQDFERPFYDDLRDGAESAEEYFAVMTQATKSRDGRLLIAEHEGRPAGFVAFRREEDDDVLLEEAARLHGYISDLYVGAVFRGLGIGRALLEAAVSQCRAQGLDRVRISVIAANRHALEVYQAQG